MKLTKKKQLFMEVKQTAVEQLVEQLKKRHLLNFTGIDKIIEQALEMEREQKIEFAINVFHAHHDTESIFLAVERTLNNK
jgi:hypothetical protein